MLHVPRSSYYYLPQHSPEQQRKNQNVKDEIMNIYMDKPFYGIRRITAELRQKGYTVNHKRVRRLHKATGLRTVYPRPHLSTSKPHPGHKVYPYLLRDLRIDHSNQVWTTDITYTKVSGCRAFVIAIIDLYSRNNLAYNVVNTMDAYSCIETLLLAMTRYGIPEIFNSDQGSQFTSKEFTDVLKEYGVKISMDGRGRCHDNAKMERFWWSLKYEDLLIKEYKSLPQLRRGVQGYVNFYNGVRLHSALNYRTPDAVYEEGLHNRAALLLQKKKTNTCNQNKEDVY